MKTKRTHPSLLESLHHRESEESCLCCFPAVLPRHSLPVCRRGKRGRAQRSLGPWSALWLKWIKGPKKLHSPELWYFESYEGFQGPFSRALACEDCLSAGGACCELGCSFGQWCVWLPNPKPWTQTVTSPNPKTQTPGLWMQITGERIFRHSPKPASGCLP